MATRKAKAVSASRLDPNMRAAAAESSPMRWHAPADALFHVAGLPWFDREHLYRRLPLASAKALPPAVNALANCPAGGQVRFSSDARHVSVRVTLAGPADMVHMPATGQCGCDLYVGAPPRYYHTTKYDRTASGYEVPMFEHAQAEMRAFTLNLPLYQGVRSVEIGLDPGARVDAPPPYAAAGRVVVYGTSITQGGCASRPGMAYTNILGRLLDREVVNLGFSGNGRGEPEVAAVVASVPRTDLFVLDYEPNCPSTEHLQATLPVFLGILRERNPEARILVMSRIAYGHDWLQAEQMRGREQRRAVQAGAVAAARAAGDTRVHFLDGGTLLGADFEACTVDQVHPNDLGFHRIAHGLAPVVRALLA